MFLRSVRDIAKPQHFAIIDALKRSTGMTVTELGRALNMSYMGVKQHCVDLEHKGWLDTWRRPIPNGRPEKLYRLTEKAVGLYPDAGMELSLDLLHSIQEVYGLHAPDKLLFSYFTRKGDAYLKRIRGNSLAERAAVLSRIRNIEGHCSDAEFDNETGFRIVEFHNPLHAIAEAFPATRRMEEQMLSRVLATPVHRHDEQVSGLTRIIFAIPAAGARHAAAG